MSIYFAAGAALSTAGELSLRYSRSREATLASYALAGIALGALSGGGGLIGYSACILTGKVGLSMQVGLALAGSTALLSLYRIRGGSRVDTRPIVYDTFQDFLGAMEEKIRQGKRYIQEYEVGNYSLIVAYDPDCGGWAGIPNMLDLNNKAIYIATNRQDMREDWKAYINGSLMNAGVFGKHRLEFGTKLNAELWFDRLKSNIAAS